MAFPSLPPNKDWKHPDKPTVDIIPFARLLMKLAKEAKDDPVTFLSMWGQLFLMDTVVAYATNILFDKPGLLVKCALDRNNDDSLKFWFDSCFPAGAIQKASDENIESAVVNARKRATPNKRVSAEKGYSLSY